MAARIDQMHELVPLSKEMLKYAESGEWDKVSKADARRRGLLDTLFAVPVEPRDAIEVDQVIREVLQLNNQLESITVAACEQAKSKSETLVSGRRAIKQYAEHSG